MLELVRRARRTRRLLDTSRLIVLSNFLRSGLVGFLAPRPNHSATLAEIVDFYFATAVPAAAEDTDLLLAYYRGAATPNKPDFIHWLIERASWLAAGRSAAQVPAADAGGDWNPVVRALHQQFDPGFPGADKAKRREAAAHWDNFLAMADAFGIVRYVNQRAELSPRALARLQRELALFGDGYFGVDDLLGVLLKVEALRAERGFIVRPPPFMLETCDALARRIGIDSYWKHSPRLAGGGCRVLDLGCGSGIYSNTFAAKGNRCVAVDATPWVFYRAFLGARPGVQVECCDMNALPARVTAEPFTHVISNIAAHHFRNRVELFAGLRDRLAPGGEICVLNFDYSPPRGTRWQPIARLKRQFAAQIHYNWTVLEFDRGGVEFISPADVARDLEAAGLAATIHPCGLMQEIYFVRGIKR